MLEYCSKLRTFFKVLMQLMKVQLRTIIVQHRQEQLNKHWFWCTIWDDKGRSTTTSSPAVPAGNSITEALSRAKRMITCKFEFGISDEISVADNAVELNEYCWIKLNEYCRINFKWILKVKLNEYCRIQLNEYCRIKLNEYCKIELNEYIYLYFELNRCDVLNWMKKNEYCYKWAGIRHLALVLGDPHNPFGNCPPDTTLFKL